MSGKPKDSKERTASKTRSRSRREPSREAESQPDVNINVRGDENAIAAAPKSIAANIRVFIQGGWKIFAAVLVVVGVLLAAILWYVVPKQDDEFGADFNVAVAAFVVVDGNGENIRSEAGVKLAETIKGQIDANFREMKLDTVTTYEVWGPDRTGTIQNEEQARQFAFDTNATIVIYGQIKQVNNVSFFSPAFFVNHTAFQEAAEITGQHELGRDVRGNLDQAILLAESPGVQARVDGMTMLTIGLVYYSVDRFDQALNYFSKADTPEWIGSGKEIVYLMIGNAYIRQASRTKDFSTLPLVEENYQKALDVNHNYGRAMIGKSNVLYLRALVEDDCDPAGLAAASALLDDAFALADQPASANIETKVHFYRGQIALIRYDCELPGEDWADIARSEFQWVVDRYEFQPGSEQSASIEFFASLAYARLGYFAYNEDNNAEAAIAYLQKAIPITSPSNQADYFSLLGDIYAAIGQTDQAVDSYQQAVAAAIGNGDVAKAEKFQQKLDSLPAP